MRGVFSSFIANSCAIQAGTIFDEMIDKARRGELDLAQIYGPLAKAIGKDGLLNPSNLPEDYSLKGVITKAYYSDNLILSSDDPKYLVRDATATILTLNNLSFQVHEVFSDLPDYLLEVKSMVDEFGGHMKIHPTMQQFLGSSNTSKPRRDLRQNGSASPASMQGDGECLPVPEVLYSTPPHQL